MLLKNDLFNFDGKDFINLSGSAISILENYLSRRELDLATEVSVFLIKHEADIIAMLFIFESGQSLSDGFHDSVLYFCRQISIPVYRTRTEKLYTAMDKKLEPASGRADIKSLINDNAGHNWKLAIVEYSSFLSRIISDNSSTDRFAVEKDILTILQSMKPEKSPSLRIKGSRFMFLFPLTSRIDSALLQNQINRGLGSFFNDNGKRNLPSVIVSILDSEEEVIDSIPDID